ncbi:hypothetical protein IWX91DRAFT_408980 [Phyllosticta citricarpa]
MGEDVTAFVTRLPTPSFASFLLIFLSNTNPSYHQLSSYALHSDASSHQPHSKYARFSMQATSCGQKVKKGGRQRIRSAPAKGCFPFLKLPREFCDEIYVFAPVVDVLRVQYIELLESRNDSDNPNSTLNRKDLKRTTFQTHTRLHFDYGTYGRVDFDQPAVSILQTCRQIPDESGLVFYSKNIFSFKEEPCIQRHVYSIGSAIAFLNDRPACAMGWIRKIKITIGNRRGWPPDERFGSLTELGILLLLQGLKRFSMEIKAEFNRRCPSDPECLVAFAALVRSHALKGGDTLGMSDITVHKRHRILSFRSTDAQGEHCPEKTPKRQYIVRCDNDESGRSLLTPAKHPSPLRISESHCERVCGPGIGLVYYVPSHSGWIHPGGEQELPDYAQSDDGETDSLEDVDLSDQDLEPAHIDAPRGTD